MLKRIALTALMLAMIPTFAFAGVYAVYKGAGAGSFSPATGLTGYATGVKTFTATADAGSVLDKVTRNGVDVSANATYVTVISATSWTITVPVNGAAQTFYVYYKTNPIAVPVVLNAVVPNSSIIAGTASSINGALSTIQFLPVGQTVSYAWAGAGLTFSPASGTVTNPLQLITSVTAANGGVIPATLTLTAGAVTSIANFNLTAQGPGVAGSYTCLQCHANQAVAVNYASSVHSGSTHSSCEACHNSTGTQNHPFDVKYATVDQTTFVTKADNIAGLPTAGTVFCTVCHKGGYSIPHVAPVPNKACVVCHTPTGAGDAHSIAAADSMTVAGCVDCHSVQQPQARTNLVNDNNGVRSITQEFGKWSHHVTGVTLNNAHCAACHLEGKVDAGTVKIDFTYHMADNMVHLRNADTDADMQWNPAAPNHSTMDNYCMSCHDANGATSAGSALIQAYINTNGIAAAGKTASAKNPFGDTISNRYDKMQRPGVTNVDSQFNTSNNSHHAVKGPRYTGRTRAAGPRQIASPATFANNSSALLQGTRSTIYDAGNLNQLYTPLENAAGETAPRTGALPLGDDSTLHCGDCHTVGQWKVGSSETANGSPTPVAIGAHGSNNEYLLRNSIGTDERHTQNAFLQGNITGTVLDPTTGLPIPNGVVVYTNPNGAFLVCYNCHSYDKYGSIYLGTGLNGANATAGPHAGEYDAQGRCNGIGNTLPFNGYTTGTATDGTQFASRFMGPITKYSSTVGAPVGEQNPDFGNIYGIQCLNCHNSGIGNAYGGIHGSANDTDWNNGTTVITPAALGAGAGGYYINGMGNAAKVERFLPGLGDIMHVAGTLGGVTGGTTFAPAGTTYTITTGGVSNDTNWEQRHWQQQAGTVINGTTGVVTGNASAGAGCYTLGASTVTGTAIITSDMSSGLEGPSVTGEGGPATEATDTWGGCDDHTAGQGKGNHGFLKRIVRPVTY